MVKSYLESMSRFEIIGIVLWAVIQLAVTTAGAVVMMAIGGSKITLVCWLLYWYVEWRSFLVNDKYP